MFVGDAKELVSCDWLQNLVFGALHYFFIFVHGIPKESHVPTDSRIPHSDQFLSKKIGVRMESETKIAEAPMDFHWNSLDF